MQRMGRKNSVGANITSFLSQKQKRGQKVVFLGCTKIKIRPASDFQRQSKKKKGEETMIAACLQIEPNGSFPQDLAPAYSGEKSPICGWEKRHIANCAER